MYEFLAPWGVLVPVISAAVVYLVVTEGRRKEQLDMIQAPTEAKRLVPSLPATRPLSMMHG